MKRSHTQGVMGLLMLLAGSLAVAEDGVHRFEASTQDYNRLVLPEPYSQIVIPPEAQLRDNPVPTDGRRGILFRPAVDAEPFSIFVQLRSGEGFTLRIEPKDDLLAQVFRFRNAPDLSEAPTIESRPNDRWITDTMLSVIQGERPSGFEAATAPASAEMPMADGATLRFTGESRYRGSRHVVNVYRVSADTHLEVEPRDFYRSGVVAVLIENDVVSPDASSRLVVLEVDNG